MTLQEIFDDLGTGEFNNVGVSDNSDVIKPDQYPKLIRHINLALSDLFSRFNLKSKEEVVELDPTVSMYSLDHLPDLLAITNVFDDYGNRLLMNEMTDDTCQVFTPSYNTLQVADVDSSNLYVIYKAKHPKLDDQGGPNQELELPPQFKQALLCYVGYRLHYNRLKDGSAEIGADMKNRYEMECKQLEGWGLTNSDSVGAKSQTRFETEGWA